MPAQQAAQQAVNALLQPGQCKRKANIELRLALADGGPLRIDPATPKTLTEAFLQTAAKHKDRGVTFVFADGRIISQPHSEILEKARCVLTGFRKSGLKAGDPIILQTASSEFHFVAFWACALGGIIPVTVAIPPSYETENGVVLKIFNTWKLLEAPAILTVSGLVEPIRGLEKLCGMTAMKILAVDELIQNEPAENFHEAHPEDILFYQLTSGSTGVPKCIQERHRSLVAHIHGSAQFNGYSPEDITLNWLPFDHVVPILTFHLKDVYLGCRQIHVQPDAVLANPTVWLDLIHEHSVTHTWSPNFGFKLVSGALQTAGQAANPSPKNWDLSCVKFFMNAGEQVTTPVVSEFLQLTKRFGVRETAMQPAFGMAEVCTCMTYTNDFSVEKTPRRFLKSSLNDILVEADGNDAATIDFVDLGPPMPGVSIRIADADNKTVPEGKIGRFQIKGQVVTPGYLNNDAANKEAFVGGGWFNSGDVGFILDGRLFLTGREKEIINIRGAKFYCYEIEDIVSSLEEVEPTFVASAGVADEKTGTEQLAIFFVPRNGANVSQLVKKIRGKVAADFGIAPAFIVPLTKQTFPKTTSGKIQRTQMRKNLEVSKYDEILQSLRNCATSGEPLSEFEAQVAEIWKQVLAVKQIAATENFFELGGDSLRAVQIVSRIRDRFKVHLSLTALFAEAAAVRGMAKLLENRIASGPAETLPPIKRVPREEPIPLSYPQQQIWILEQLRPGTSLYNVSRVLELTGELDAAALERSLDEMLARHEVLRTNLVVDGNPTQKIRPSAQLKLSATDLGKFPATERMRAAFALAVLDAKRPFDLASELLVRAKLMRSGEDRHVFALTFHQSVIDGVSVDIFIRELGNICAQRTDGHSALRTPHSNFQYSDFAFWQREVFAPEKIQPHLDYWRQQLDGNIATELPTDFPRRESIEAATEKWEIPEPIVSQIKNFSRARGVTLFATLLAAFKSVLSGRTKHDDISVGSAMSLRNVTELENMVGFIVNPVVLRTKISDASDFAALTRKVQQTIFDASAHAAAPFEMVAATLQKARCGSESRAPELFKIYFGAIDSLGEFSFGDVQAQSHFISPGTAQFDLTVFVAEQREKIVCLFEYKTALFGQETIRALMRDFERALVNGLR